ncbi:MAG: TolC family protein [Gemmatimonadota bacterium]
MAGPNGRTIGALASGLLLGLAPPAVAQQRLGLEDALRTALSRNPSLASAEADAAAAGAARLADWGSLLPTASASASLSDNRFTNTTFLSPEGVSQRLDNPITSTTKSASQTLTFRMDLLNLGKIGDVRGGGARRGAAELRLTAAERTVVRDVKKAYFEALKQTRLTEVAERQLMARKQDLEVTEQRYRIAAASRSDLLGAEIDLRDAELRVLDARDAFATAVRALQTLLAVDVTEASPEEVTLTDVEDIPDASELDVEALVARAMRGNPTLAALEADAAAASASLFTARSAYLPTVSASLSLGRSEQLGPADAFFQFSPSNTNRTFSLSASWSLFNGFSRRRSTARASQSLRKAESDRARQSLALEKDVRDLVAQIRRRARRLEILADNADLARERLELAREQYRLGTIAYFNLQQAIDRLNSAEQALFQERYDYLSAWADLEERVGGEM